jgi:carbonic anhydrase
MIAGEAQWSVHSAVKPCMMRPTSIPMRRSLVLSLVLSVSAATAADWVPIPMPGGGQLELDRAGVVRQGDVATAWDRRSYAPGERVPAGGDVAYRTVRTLMRYDCVTRTVVPLVRAFSQADGSLVSRQNVEGSELPEVVVPDSPRERALELACAVKPKVPDAVVAKGETKPGKGANGGEAKPAATADAKGSGKPDAKPAADGAADPAKTAAGATRKPVEAKGAPPKAEGAEEGEAAADPAPAPPPAPVKDNPVAKGKGGQNPGKAAAAKADEQKPAKTAWTYDGPAGAAHWHKLSPEYAACGEGKRQSPIDIRDGVRSQQEPLVFNYKPSALRVHNNGRTLEVPHDAGSQLSISGKTYELVGFHFHRPSEERINGRRFDMSAHLMHRSTDGQWLAVAVVFMAGDEHPFIKTLWNSIPLDVGMVEQAGAVKIDASQLLPKLRGYYTFMGSLTEPPCTEGVRWIVMRTPVQMSRNQLETFGRLYEMNARPVQPVNGRLIKEVP